MKRNGKRALSFIMALVLALSLLPAGVLALDEETPAQPAQVEQAAETPEVTEAPTETAAPVATAAPTETAAPETTAAPTETAAPETTTAPAETAAPETTAAPTETAAPTATETPEIRYPAFSADVSAEDNNGMAVAVTAPEGAFPEGTELSVKPVKDSSVKAALDSVLEFFGLGSLVGESTLGKIADALGAGTEQDAAAFDITFLYNGKEVQPAADPATGEPFAVTVTFTPGEDSALTGAGDLQVYHITDGDMGLNADAVKTADADSIKAEPVDAVDGTGADGTVTVEATSFSIYVVADTGSTKNISGGNVVAVGHSIILYSNIAPGSGYKNSWVVTARTGSAGRATIAVNSDSRYATLTGVSAGTVTVTCDTPRGASIVGHDTLSVTVTEAPLLTIADNIKATGCLTATLDAGVSVPEGTTATYTWYRSSDGTTGSYASVARQKVTGDSYNVNGENLNAELDYKAAGLIDDSLRYYYYVTATVGDETYTSAPSQVPYYMAIQNGGFEAEAPNSNWSTTASNGAIEIGDYSDTMKKYGTQSDYATYTTGNNKFAELNADDAGSLYQDVLTVPGNTLNWSVDHRARNANNAGTYYKTATDTMYVVIMSAADAEMLLAGVSPSDQQDVMSAMVARVLGSRPTATNVSYTLTRGSNSGSRVSVTVMKESTTSNIVYKNGVYTSTKQWKTYSGQYSVPEGQYATRFFFVAGDTQSGNPTVGNLIDNVWFSQKLPSPNPGTANLTVTKTVTGVPGTASLSGYSVAVTVTKDSDTRSATISNFTWNGTNWVGTCGFASLPVGDWSVSEAVSGSISGYKAADTGNTTTANVTLADQDNGTAALTNAYTAATASFKFDKVWDGAAGSGITVTVTDGTTDYTFTVDAAAASAEGAAVAWTKTVDGNTWHISATLPAHAASASYSVKSETAISGYTTTYIRASTTATLSAVHRINPCNALTIAGVSAPFIAIKSQNNFILWTAENTGDDGEKLAAAIAASELDAGPFKNITSGYTYIHGAQTISGISVKINGTTISYSGGETSVTFPASNAWANLLCGRYDMPKDVDTIINSQSIATQGVTFTKTWAGNASRPTANSIGVTISDGTINDSATITSAATSGTTTGNRTWTKSVNAATGVWNVTVSGLPASAAGYTVTETEVNGTGFTDGKAANDIDGYWVESQTENAISNTYYTYAEAYAYGSANLTLTKNEVGNTALKLSGAKFKLYTDSACEHEYSDAVYTTGEDGTVVIPLTSASTSDTTYYLKEIAAPADHVVAAPIEITVAQTFSNNTTETTGYVTTTTHHYTASVSGTGISNSAVTVSDPKITSTLTINKSVTYDSTKSIEPPTDDTFAFTLTFGTGATTTAITGTTAYAANTAYTFSLADVGSISITGVPVGTVYTLSETAKANYTNNLDTTARTMPASDNSITVTNTYFKSITTGVSAAKTWMQYAETGNVSFTGTKPSSITLQLYKNGTASGGPVTVTAADSWTHNFGDLAEFDSASSTANRYSVQETAITYGTGASAVTVNLSNDRAVVYGSKTVAGSTPVVTEVDGYWVATYNGLNVTNTWYDSDDIGSASISVGKYIVNTTNRLAGAAFTLTCTALNYSNTRSSSTSGDVSFDNLQPGEYTLTESTVPGGYSASPTNWTFTVTKEGAKLTGVSGGPVTGTTGTADNIFTNTWQWIVTQVNPNTYYSNGVLTVYNTPVVTGVAKTVWSEAYTASSFDAAAYPATSTKWAGSASFTENPGVTTATALFKVVVSGTPGATYDLRDTATVGATLTKVSGALTGTIPDGGSVTVYYTMTVPVDDAIYTNTATVGTLSATATATASTDTAQNAAITVNYWKQNSYGDYVMANYTKVTADSIENQEMAYEIPAYASAYATGDKYLGYTLSTQNPAAPISIPYQEAYNANHAATPSNLVINVYYDMNMPTVNLTANKAWNHGTGSGANTAVNKANLGAVSFQLQRSSDGTTWANVGDAVSVTTTTNGTNGAYTWNSMPKYVENSTTEYTYRVHEVTVPTGYTTTTNDAVFTAGAAAGVMSATITNTYDPTYLDIVDGTKASFPINKVGNDGAKLAGAVFTLTKAGAADRTVTTAGPDGTATVGDLTDGTYTLTETTAPGGYTKSSSSWTITVAKDALVYGAPNANNQITRTQNYFISAITGTTGAGDYSIIGNTITVTDTRDTGTLQITKIVSGLRGAAASAEHTYTFTATDSSDSSKTYTYTATVNGNGSQTTTGNAAPSEIRLPTGTYTVTEAAANINEHSGPTTTYSAADGSVTIAKDTQATLTVTNAYSYDVDSHTQTITATKNWNDGSNRDGIRPASFTLTLTDAHGTVIETKIVTAAAADTQTVTFSFDAYANGFAPPFKVTETKYTLTNGTEVAIGSTGAAYAVAYASGNNTDGTVAGNAITITNTHAVETVTINVAKKWTEPAYAREVTLNLVDGSGNVAGTVTLDGTVDATETAAWSASFGSFPKNAGGKAIAYTVTEASLGANWSCTVTSDMAAAVNDTYHFTVTNSLYMPYIPPEKPIPDPDVPLEPTPVTPVEPGTDITDPDVPQAGAAEQTTGDELYLWIALAAASGMSLAWLAISGKKRRDENNK